MKTRLFILLAAATFMLGSSSCRRHKEDVSPEDGTVYIAQGADESAASGESDNVVSDVVATMQSASSPGGGRAAAFNVCAATTTIVGKVITLTFDGTSCNGRTRSGTVKIELIAGNKWRDANAMLKVDFINYKINKTWNGANRTAVINGVHYIKNISGGQVDELASGATIVHRVTGSMTMTFDSGQSRNWKLARTRTYSISGTQVNLAIAGDTTVGGVSNVDIVGTNRFGNEFTTVISTPIQVNSNCGWSNPTAGVKTHTGAFGKSVSVTFGTDMNGDAVAGSGCPSYYKIAYTLRNGNTYTRVNPYN